MDRSMTDRYHNVDCTFEFGFFFYQFRYALLIERSLNTCFGLKPIPSIIGARHHRLHFRCIASCGCKTRIVISSVHDRMRMNSNCSCLIDRFSDERARILLFHFLHMRVHRVCACLGLLLACKPVVELFERRFLLVPRSLFDRRGFFALLRHFLQSTRQVVDVH